jgi:hypothetical protein
MAQATPSLPLPITLATCPFTIITQARLTAFNIVKVKLITQGVKPSSIPRSTITAAANDYLRSHPELIDQAAESIQKYPPLRMLAEREAREPKRMREKGLANSSDQKAPIHAGF